MRKNIVAGNWKMNMNKVEAMQLLNDVLNYPLSETVEIIIAPPAIYLSEFIQKTKGTQIRLAAQNVHYQINGAFTGEISATMLSTLQLDYCLVGHSERRQYFHETNEQTGKKVDALLDAGVTPILCVGEMLEHRYQNTQVQIVIEQLESGMGFLSETDAKKLVIAYEPVWAIGTGQTATAEQAQEMHAEIRKYLNKKWLAASEDISILYGGSCNAQNAKELFANKDVDGGLIGGASLKQLDFATIINSFS